MNKKHLSGIFFTFMIILFGSTLANKDSESVKLPTSNSVLYQNNVMLAQKNQQTIVKTTFRKGDKGTKVKEIQQKLNKFGYKLYVDGDFGRLTYNAVIDFQMRNKLIRDGIVGKLTLKKLNMPSTPSTMYKPPVKKKSIPKATASKKELEKFINNKNVPSFTSYFIWIDTVHQRVNWFEGSNKKWNLVKFITRECKVIIRRC